MLKNTTALTAAILLATPLAAQELTYASGSFEFERLNSDELEGTDVRELTAEAEFTLNQFVLGVSIDDANFNSDEGLGIGVTTLRATAGYMITPEIMIGAGVSNIAFVGGFGPTEDATGYEVFGQYETAQFAVAARFQKPDNDLDDFQFTTFAAEFSVTPDVKVSGVLETLKDEDSSYHVAADYDAGPYFARAFYTSVQDANEGVVGASGGYRFSDQLALSAGYQTATGDDEFDYSLLSVGGSYTVMDGLVASASYGMLDGDFVGGDGTDVRVAITYELGASKRVDTRLFDAARSDLSGGPLGVNPVADFGLFEPVLFGFGFD